MNCCERSAVDCSKCIGAFSWPCSLFIPLTTIADQWPVFSGQKCSLQNDNFQLVENVRLNLSDFQLFRVEPTRVSDFLLDKFVLTHFRLLLNWFSCQNFTFLS